MSDIFISYAREDREKAKALAEVFAEQGWSVWWDRNIPPGVSFDAVIEEEINAAKCIVVLWSRSSITSDWVKGEAGEGSARKALVPVRIDASKVPLEFRRLQTVDLCGWDRGESHPEMAGLLEAIAKQINAPVKSVPRGPRWLPSAKLLFGAAVAIALLGGAFFLLKPDHPTPAPSAIDEPTAGADETEIRSTHNLRLEFYQDGQPARMFTATENGYPIVRVALKQRPLEIRADYYDAAIQLCASSDDSIFGQIQAGMKLEDVPYFIPGTGLAPDGETYTTLLLDRRAQHYLIDERLQHLADGRVSFTFNAARNDSGTLAKWPSRIYLVVLSDVNHRGVIDAEEFERIVLEFAK